MENHRPHPKLPTPQPERKGSVPQSQNEAASLRRMMPRRMMPRRRQPRLPAMEYRLVSLFEE